MSEILEFFENLDEVVYAADIDTYELIYMNKYARELYHFTQKSDYLGKYCYDVLQSCLSPCAICTNDKLKCGQFYEWSRYSPVTKKHYILKDTMIIENGRKIRVEIAVDMNMHNIEKHSEEETLSNEAIINEGLKCFLAAPTPEKSLKMLTQHFGQIFSSDRVYIFEKQPNGTYDNTFEWCASNTTTQKDFLCGITESDLGSWLPAFKNGECVIIKNINNIINSDPIVYSFLKPQNIKSLVVAPVLRGKDLIGFFGIDNPPVDRLNHVAFMLKVLGHFINSMLKRRDLVNKLESLSYYDQLTGAKNRHAMSEKITSIPSYVSLGIVYADIMGLKRINDSLGHLAGDNAIIEAFNTLKADFPKECIYRIGGDEFLILLPGITESRFEGIVEDLKKHMERASVHLAVGSVWVPFCKENVEKYMSEADSKMYENKRDYYNNHNFG